MSDFWVLHRGAMERVPLRDVRSGDVISWSRGQFISVLVSSRTSVSVSCVWSRSLVEWDRGRCLSTCKDQERHCLDIINAQYVSRIDLKNSPVRPSSSISNQRQWCSWGNWASYGETAKIWSLYFLPLLCAPASSAPVQRVLSDRTSLLESFVFLK